VILTKLAALYDRRQLTNYLHNSLLVAAI